MVGRETAHRQPSVPPLERGTGKVPSGTCLSQVGYSIVVRGSPAAAHGRTLGKWTKASSSTMEMPMVTPRQQKANELTDAEP